MSQTPQSLNAFVSKFCEWADLDDRSSRARLSGALRRAVLQELPQRDGAAEWEYRLLTNGEGVSGFYTSPISKLYLNTNKTLVLAVLSPDWRVGWRSISRDAYTADLVREFFRLARQYISRSRMAGVVGGVAFTYGRACGFQFPASMTLSRANLDSTPTAWMPYSRSIVDAAAQIESGDIFQADPRQKSTGRKDRELHTWIDNANTLDPFVHRAVFQFWRATALREQQFWEESVTALDRTVSVVAQFLKQRIGIKGDVRSQLAGTLGMSRADQGIFDQLYQLRCDFGAHPSNFKWWDFAELYDESVEVMREVVTRAVWHLLLIEQQHRVVDPTPIVWSQWFTENASMVWDAVWFENVAFSQHRAREVPG